MSTFPTVVLDVGDYGFGSVSMALSIAPFLAGSANLVALGRGEAVAQLRSCPDIGLVLDVSDRESPLPAEVAGGRVQSWCDLSTDDLRCWADAATTGVPYTHVSMHAWRVERAPAVPYHVPQATTLFERYPSFEVDAARMQMPESAFVPPVIGLPPMPTEPVERDLALVTLGGARVPGLADPHAGTRLLAAVARYALREVAPGLPSVICCGPSAAAALGSEFDGAPVISPPRSEYLELMRRARIVLAQPSLHSPLEPMWWEHPVALLPPQNFTQWFHLGHWEHAELPGTRALLKQLAPELEFDVFGSEGAQDVMLSRAQHRLLGDADAVAALGDAVAAVTADGLDDPQAMIWRQTAVSASMGGTRGAAEVAEFLLKAADDAH